MTGTAEVLEKHFPFITPSHIHRLLRKTFNTKAVRTGNIRVITLKCIDQNAEEMQEEKQ